MTAVAPRAAALCLAGMLAAGSAAAAIAPGSSGNGELFFNAFDSTARASYTKDLGLTINDFFIAGQPDAGLQLFFVVDDPLWTEFLTKVTVANLLWSVNAIDSTGSPSTPGNQRLFTTVRQGDELVSRTIVNSRLSDGLGAAQAGLFFNTINSAALAQRGQSTHTVDSDPTRFDIHGSSWSLQNDPGAAYYGKSPGLTHTLNGFAPFSSGNRVGRSSWFYYLTQSGPSPGSRVSVDEFDNLGNDGYWGFVEVTSDLDPDSPFLGKYLLSYTIASALPTPQQRSFAAGIGRTEFTGGFSTQRLAGEAASGAEAAAGGTVALGTVSGGATGLPALLPMPVLLPMLDGLAQSPATMAPAAVVPEPSTWALGLLGGLALWARMTVRRRST